MVTQVMKDRIWITVIIALVSGGGFGGSAVTLLGQGNSTATKEDLAASVRGVTDELANVEGRIKQYLLDREYVTHSSMSSYVKDEIKSAPYPWKDDKDYIIDAISVNADGIKELVQLTHEVQLELVQLKAKRR